MNTLERNSAIRQHAPMAVRHPEAMQLLRSQAWHMFWLGVLTGVAGGGTAIMVGVIIAVQMYVS